MGIVNNFISHSLFKNKELNQFSLSVFLMHFGESLISIFVPIYFYTRGVEIYQIIFFYFLVSFFFLLFSFLGVRVVAKVGEKRAILISSPFLILYYLGLFYFNQFSFLFYLLPLLLSLRMILFNYGYHLIFINSSCYKKRGREVAGFGVVTLMATFLAPYVGGLLADFNFNILFLLSSFLMIVGTFPLFFSKDKKEKVNFKLKDVVVNILSKKERGNTVSFCGYAIESIICRTVWPIFIFIVVGTIYRTGLVMSLSALVSVAAFYFIGHLADKVDRVKLIKIGNIFYIFVWIGRSFVSTFSGIFLVDTYRNIVIKILHVPWSAHSYDLSKKGDYFEFVVRREIIFNAIRILVMPALITLFYFNFHPFMLSFLIAGLFSFGYMFINK